MRIRPDFTITLKSASVRAPPPIITEMNFTARKPLDPHMIIISGGIVKRIDSAPLEISPAGPNA
jgi:hypothetical protein